MRFRKLELLGFKSFAEPTELTFEPGVTAIIGPNGTGKSNIADAIKWVLGEQSARQLRGGKMEDLIFSGTDHRDPIHFAEVTLTLENSDKSLAIGYSEVAITRRLYRSGESEYLLNGTQVRLKDITELLLGTGIGTSAYSLFEQGRIEQILNARPEERRVVFEEAAGITKYKEKRREAMRRLEETEANLLRISDVIAEVKRQIQALERQVKRAKAYQEELERLKELEVKVSRHEESKLTCSFKEKEEGLKELRRQAGELQEKLQSQENRFSRARDAVDEIDSDLSRARESLLEVTQRQQTLRQRLELTQERILDAERRREQLKKELTLAQEQIERVRKDHEELKASLEKADAERREKEDQIDQALRRLEACTQLIRQAEEFIGQTQERVLEETGSQVKVRNTLTKAHQELSRFEARVNRLSMEETKVAQERSEALGQLKRLQEQMEQVEEQRQEVLRERTTVRQKLDQAEGNFRKLKERASGLEQEKTRLRYQLEFLRGLLASHEGYSSGLKTLLRALDEGRLSREGVSGVLAELMEIPQEDRAAVDAALGPYALGVVVESDSVVQRCQEFLEENQAGRVLFLIRDRVPEGSVSSGTPPGLPSVALIERVGITPHLEPLLKFLFLDTWLVENQDLIEKFFVHRSFPLPRTLCLVTRGGELFTGIGALLGSAPKEEALVVGRRSRLDSLEGAWGQATRHWEETKGKISLLEEECKALGQSLETLQASFQEKNQLAQRIQATLQASQAAWEKLDQESELLKAERAEAQEELESARQEVEKLEGELKVKDQTINQLQAVIQEKQALISQSAKDRETISVDLARWKAELSSFGEVLVSRRGSLELLQQTLKGEESRQALAGEELAHLEENRNQWEAGCKEFSVSLDRLSQEESERKTEVSRCQEKRRSLIEAAQVEERQWIGIGRRLEKLNSQIHYVEMEQAQISFQRQQRISRLQQLYQVNLEGFSTEGPCALSDEELADLKGRIEGLSQKLQRMGPVNLASIEEERELLGRHEHLVTQQNDLLKAKDDLHEAITQINRTTRAMFKETFQAIQKEFQVTFRKLFAGGEARLLLLDEEDLLESGIEIIARPPGRSLQAISLLSGGEKALTTIALLFAIFRVKPSPFCVLDEIDAPLDESNIGRFTDCLKEFLKDSQFILITHNKKTITMADCWYGITMEESGVSKIVSVKFPSQEPKQVEV